MGSGRRLHVGKLDPRTTKKDLEDLFFRIGDIVDSRVLERFGFVEFERLRDAEKAVEKLHGFELLGSRISVDYARPPRSAEDRRNGGGRGYDPSYDRRGSSWGDSSRGGGGSRDRFDGDYGNDHYGSPSRPYRGCGGGRSGNPRGFKVRVTDLRPGTSWQDLKDFGRKAGLVTFADMIDSTEGFLQYASAQAADDAVRDLDRRMLDDSLVRVYSEDDSSNYYHHDRDSRDRDSGYSSRSRNSNGRDYSKDAPGEGGGHVKQLSYDEPPARGKSPVVSKSERGRSRSPIRDNTGDDGWG